MKKLFLFIFALAVCTVGVKKVSAQEVFLEHEYMTFQVSKNTGHTISLYVDKTYPVPGRYTFRKLYHYVKNNTHSDTSYVMVCSDAKNPKNDAILIECQCGNAPQKKCVYTITRNGVYPISVPDDNIAVYMYMSNDIYNMLLEKASE